MVTTRVAEQVANTVSNTFVEAGIRGDRAKFALRGRQGSRNTYSLTVPVGELFDLVTRVGVNDDSLQTNRAVSEEWVRRIVRNLRVQLLKGMDTKYILFPMTANVGEGDVLFRSLSEGDSMESEGGLADVGILVIPQGLKFSVADGQHRLEAFRRLAEEFSWLSRQALTLLLIEESDITQRQLDFATAGKTLPLTRALLAYFDSSVAINYATKQFIAHSKMIDESDVEKFKNTASGKRNPSLWTFNQLVSYVGAGLAGGSLVQKTEALAEAFENRIDNRQWRVDGPEVNSYAREMASCMDVFLSDNVGRVLSQAKARPDLVSDWNEVRSRSLIFKGVGINTLGALLYDLRRVRGDLVEKGELLPSEEADWLQDKVREIAAWDWSPSSEVFRGTLVRGTGEGSRVVSSTTAVSSAVVLSRARLGLLDFVSRKAAESLLTSMGEVDGSTNMTIGEIKVSREVKDRIRMARREEVTT